MIYILVVSLAKITKGAMINTLSRYTRLMMSTL